MTTSWGGHLHILAQNISDADRLAPGDQVIVTWEKDHGFALPASTLAPTSVVTESDDSPA